MKKGKQRLSLYLFGLLCWVGSGLSANARGEQVQIPGGSYLPFYRIDKENQAKPVKVKSYAIDTHPVTNADFLDFVKSNPKWRKSQVKPIFADSSYLKHWRGDLQFSTSFSNRPVNYIPWFAAKAYCQAQQKQLPTVDQWEFAALADETRRDASKDPVFIAKILSWYGRPTTQVLPQVGATRNVYGVYDLHGLAWEWTRDFNSIMITGESREDAGGVNRGLYCAGGASAGANPADYASYMRYAFRSSLSAQYTVRNLTFRCVKEL